MLDMLYEAEALVEMALRRKDGKLSDTVKRLVADKCFGLADIAAGWNIPEEAPACGCKHDPVYTPEAAKTPREERCVSEDEADNVALAESEMLEIVAMATADPEEDAAASAATDVCVADTAPDDESFAEDSSADDTEEYDAPEDDTEEYEEEEEADDEGEYGLPPVPRRERAPLLSFFTINDRYRFRRSLFGGSNPAFLESLAVIESLDSGAQAADYAADDLQWDMDSPEVKLFLDIVGRYFAS